MSLSPETTRGDLIQLLLSNQGWHPSVLEVFPKAIRDSSTKVYNRYWREFTTFMSRKCGRWGQVSLPLICEFLLELSTLGHLSVRTIQSYVSALKFPLVFLLGKDLFAISTFRPFMKGLRNRTTNARTPAIQWNLEVVLAYLRSDVFEPPARASLILMFRKCLFLLALASGRRVSELAALGASAPYLLVPNRDKAVLTYRAGFLAKNETASCCHNPIVLQGLRPSCPDTQDYWLCPLRALKFFLHRVHRRLRSPEVQLFQRSPGRDSSPAMLSRELVTLIRDAHAKISDSTAQELDFRAMRYGQLPLLVSGCSPLAGVS